jgi:hypothetical protein
MVMMTAMAVAEVAAAATATATATVVVAEVEVAVPCGGGGGVDGSGLRLWYESMLEVPSTKAYNLPVAKVLYIVGRTDQTRGMNPKWGKKKPCLWTGP